MTGGSGRGAGWGAASGKSVGGRAARLLLGAALVLAGAACASGGQALPAPAPPSTAPLLPDVAEESPPVTDAPTTTAAPAPPSEPAAAADDPTLEGSRPPGSPRLAGPPTPTGRIEIPAIGLHHPTFEGNTLDIIDYGPSHWPGTAMPGEPGNTVFPGHRVTRTRPFFDIDRLVVGDLVIFTTPAGRFTYRVAETLVVAPGAIWITDPTPGPTMTIFGCHPKGSARYRYVVRGPLVASPPAPPPPSTTTTTEAPAVGLPCLLCLGGR